MMISVSVRLAVEMGMRNVDRTPPYENRHTQMVFDRKRTYHKNTYDADDAANARIDPERQKYKVEKTARSACKSVNLLTENERDLIDADVTQHTAENGRYDTHYDSLPPADKRAGLLGGNHLLHAYDHKNRNRNRIEHKPGYLLGNDASAEKRNSQHGKKRRNQVTGVFHPKRRFLHKDIAQGPPAESGYESDHIRPEPVEVLDAGHAHAGYRADKSPDLGQNLKKRPWAEHSLEGFDHKIHGLHFFRF
jgi:hypothetical protein